MNDSLRKLKTTQAKVRRIKKRIDGVLEGIYDDETERHDKHLLSTETRIWLQSQERQLEEAIASQEALSRFVTAEDYDVTLDALTTLDNLRFT